MNNISKAVIQLWLAAFVCCVLFGCSGSGGDFTAPSDIPDEFQQCETSENHMLWGIWEIHFDPANLAVTVVPLRDTHAHYNVTGMLLPPACYDCLKIKVNSFNEKTRLLDADVTLRNPLQISGYDVRGILYTNDYGHELRNADDWTGLFDIPGGQAINPFIAFAKDQPKRIFAAGAEHKEKYTVYIPLPPKYEKITYAVDASYPGNCLEPYEIVNFWHEDILNFTDSSGKVSVDVNDWQGDVDKVILIAPQITGQAYNEFTYSTGSTWTINLTNNTGAEPGDYKVRIIANSTGATNLPLYDYATIHIDPQFNMVNVMPPELNFVPVDVSIEGDYAYVAACSTGLQIFDITNRENPVRVKWIAGDEISNAQDVCVEGGYVYIADWNKGFHIVDATNPESAQIIRTVELSGCPTGVAVFNGYAYVANQAKGLHIIDIDPPESASLINTLPIIFACLVSVYDNYAFVGGSHGNMQIVDITSPESASVIKTITISNLVGVAFVSDGYAYISGSNNGLLVADIDPIQDSYITNTIPLSGSSTGLTMVGPYIYICNSDGGFNILHIDSPGVVSIIKNVDTPGWACGIGVVDNFAYIADGSSLQVAVIDPPESAYIINSFDVIGAVQSVEVNGDLLFAADSYMGLHIIDINPPESPQLICSVDTPGYAYGVAVNQEYAYVTDYTAGLIIMDINPPEKAYIVNTIATAGVPYGIAVDSDYAYIAEKGIGLEIIDIDPPESAHSVKTVTTGSSASAVVVADGYAYLSGYKLSIIDITVPETAHVIKELSVGGYPHPSYGLTVLGGYAYVTNANSALNLQIFDIDPPESAYQLHAASVPGNPFDVSVSLGNAFVASYYNGLQVVDVNPKKGAHVVSSIGMSGYAMDIVLNDEYAFLACWDGGLSIIRLW